MALSMASAGVAIIQSNPVIPTARLVGFIGVMLERIN
jgi:hypothetical protein